MKKIFYFVIAIMTCLVSCDRNGQVVPEAEEPTSRKIETGNVTEITSSTAIVSASTKIDVSEYQDVAFGVIYSDSQEELSARKGNRKEAAYLNGKEFEVELKGLKPQTTYYYCAWLFLNGKQYEYGNIKQFTTLEGNIYAIGEFSVSNNKKVAFSSGNLQYQASTNTWRFAENQWDYIGGANSNISSSYSGWIDLFGWGTGDTPTKSSASENYSRFINWGNNTINGEHPNTWRTLTAEEWRYILAGRPNSHSLYATATVNNIYGFVILPDSWNQPHLSFVAGTKGWDHNVYSVNEWKELEYEGAIFFPAAGYRSKLTVNSVEKYGIYWSATRYNNYGSAFAFSSGEVRVDSYFNGSLYDHYGCCVRLVKDLQ